MINELAYCNHPYITALAIRHNRYVRDVILWHVEGGTNSLDNLVSSCYTCNGKKGSKSYEKFKSQREATEQEIAL